MLMITQTPEYGENGVLVVGDVAVTPMPDASQLAQIAVCTAQTAKSVAGFADPKVAMLIFAAIVVVYTFLGGFNAVCWTDFFQGLLMLGAVLIVRMLYSVFFEDKI